MTHRQELHSFSLKWHTQSPAGGLGAARFFSAQLIPAGAAIEGRAVRREPGQKEGREEVRLAGRRGGRHWHRETRGTGEGEPCKTETLLRLDAYTDVPSVEAVITRPRLLAVPLSP